MLKIDRLTIKFGGLIAVNNVSAEVKQNTILSGTCDDLISNELIQKSYLGVDDHDTTFF